MDENNDSQLNISNKDNEDDKKEIEKSKVIEIIEETVIEEDEESLFAFVGQKAPIFKEISWSGSHYKMVNLKDYIGKYIILKFYDKNFTNQTIEEINLYADNYENLKKLNCECLFISTESKYSHKEFASFLIADGGIKPLKFPLISDIKHIISKKYCVLNDGKCLNGTFIINPEGILKHSVVGEVEVHGDFNETIRLLQAFQFSDKYSVVCQSKWVPGKKGINATFRDPRLKRFWTEELIGIPYEENITENSENEIPIVKKLTKESKKSKHSDNIEIDENLNTDSNKNDNQEIFAQ